MKRTIPLSFTRTFSSFLVAVVGLFGGLLNPTGAGANVQENLLLPNIPLFVNISATPNIFLQMDDSGSMDWDILTPTHFTTCRYNTEKGCSTLEATGEFYDWTGYRDWYGNKIFRTFEYVETSDDDAYSTHCYNSSRDVIELCPSRDDSAPWDWRVRSSDLNVLFFNPAIQYMPWPGYTNASFSAARSYPDSAQPGYNDADNLDGFTYHYWIDDKGFSGSRPDWTDVTEGPNGIVDEWDSHVEVVVYAGSFSCTLYSYDPGSNGLNPETKVLDTANALCQEAIGINGSASNLSQNVANWFQYYRRRNMVARAAVSRTISTLPAFRYGFSLINNYELFVEMPEESVTDFGVHNADLIRQYLEHPQQVYGTPLRRGLERVGRYLKGDLSGKESPIVSPCQKNFTILFSDGYWNGGSPYVANYDVDRDRGEIMGTRNLLADVAYYYYREDLRRDLANLVPTDNFDSANHQHMVTFTIGFGVEGSLTDIDDDGWPDNLDNGSKWYLIDSNDNERRVDDLWHAAWNSRGRYISAKRPEDLINELSGAILDISDRVGGAASGATNGGSIHSESKVFQAKFDAVDWHGSLLAINVNSEDGELDTIEWEAGTILNEKSDSWFENTRNVFTYKDSTLNGIEFHWSNLSVNQQTLMSTNPDNGQLDILGDKRVDYIRGSSAYEGDFRVRGNRLGGIVHSDPQYVAFPPFYYNFGNYKDFALANENRQTVIYVGANDGMLHAFSEDDGSELFTYVPNEIMSRLPKLTSNSYVHEFYVDGSPVYADIESGESWKSVLIGTLRSGGQGLFALDITTPSSFNANDVMWEFTDADDADLGYFFGEPQVRKMANGKWAAIFTSGYNNTESDGHASSDGKDYVYILYINQGLDGWNETDYVKIAVPNADGLSAPAVADVDGDAIADFIYVGDLDGNMWKIDVTSTSSGSWSLAFSGQPLFVARDSSGARQPITNRPAIMTHPLSIREGVLVIFGTGKYIEIADDVAEGYQEQSIYGIWDRDGYYNRNYAERNSTGDHGFSRNQLSTPELTVDGDSGLRIIHDYAANLPIWFDEDGTPENRGWYVDLPEEGERIVRKIILRNKIAMVVTLIPEDDVCSAGGSGWFMALNAQTGTAPTFPVIDINDDNAVDELDMLAVSDPENPDEIQLVSPIGTRMDSIPNLPALLYDDRPADLGSPFPLRPNAARGCDADGAKSFTYTTRTNGSIVMIVTEHQPNECGRQSWFQTH